MYEKPELEPKWEGAREKKIETDRQRGIVGANVF